MHFGGPAGRVKGFIDRAFRERQVFLRTGARVSFTILTRRRQMAVAALVLGFVVWSVYASIVYFSYDARLAASEARFVSARTAYERAIAERNAAIAETRQSYRSFLAAIVHPFELLGDARIESQQELIALRGRNAKLALDMSALERELAKSRAERERLASSDEALSRRSAALESELAELKQKNGTLDGRVATLEGELSASRSHEQAIAQDNANLGKALDDSKRDVADARQRNEAAAAQIATLESGLAGLADERNRLGQERAALALHVDELEQRLVALQADQTALIARLSERATNRSMAVEHAIAMTGLDVNKLLGEASKDDWSRHAAKSGVGGPFVAYRPEKSAAGKSSARSGDIELVVSTLDRQEERHEGLKRILARLPLASPIDGYRIVSDFGKRIDPINGRLAMHEGVDLTSEPGAKVLATAPGVVVFAGWDGSYGKLVEIDHGMGVRTRYAHLRSIVVEVGSRVLTRTEVGIIGSTGRSTGTHVHYEVLVDDQHYDPVKFIKAGEYVFSKN
ncbi:MAG TPA: peptidoglycan DD-metalloendopeptidase family protein [Alphaproteobacteria bacterium]|nr:peptidoglycan DD-metalloendopeptidase family protein [Alphaproteobacteria bacterium]